MKIAIKIAGMFIRQYFQKEKGCRTAYWALVESYRTANGPRQRVVAWLGKLDEAGRLGVQQAVEGTSSLIAPPFGVAQLFRSAGASPAARATDAV